MELLGAQRDLDQVPSIHTDGRHGAPRARRQAGCGNPSPAQPPCESGRRRSSTDGDRGGRAGGRDVYLFAPGRCREATAPGGAAARAGGESPGRRRRRRPKPGPGPAAPPQGAQDPEAAKSAAHDQRWPVSQHTFSAQVELRADDGYQDGELRVRDQRDGACSNRRRVPRPEGLEGSRAAGCGEAGSKRNIVAA